MSEHDDNVKTIGARIALPVPAHEVYTPSRLASRCILEAMRWAVDQVAAYGQEYPYLTGISVDYHEPEGVPTGILLSISLSRQQPVCGPFPLIHSVDGSIWAPRLATDPPDEVPL